MGKGGGKTQYVSYPTQQQTQQQTKIEPWAPTAQPLQDLMNEALAQYYSEPSVQGYRAPSTSQVPIYGNAGGSAGTSGLAETDLYADRFGSLLPNQRTSVTNALQKAIQDAGYTYRPAAEPRRIYAGTRGDNWLGDTPRVTNEFGGNPAQWVLPNTNRAIDADMLSSNPIRAINMAGLNWQDIVQSAGQYGTPGTPGSNQITGYRTETDPGSPGVYIAPETRMLADFLGSEALNRGYYEAPLQMYGDYLTRASGGGYSLNPNDYLMDWQAGINPYAEDMYSQLSDDVQSRVMGAMNSAGRLGSGAGTRILTEELGDLGTRFYQPIYENEMQRRFQAEAANKERSLGIDAGNRAFIDAASKLLPNVHQARRDLTTWIAGLLEQSGDLRKQIADRPNLERTQALQRAMAAITPLSGIGGITNVSGTTSGTQSQPFFSNPAASAIGGLTGLLGGVGGLLGGIGALSGREFKEDISEAEGAIDKLRNVEIKTWKYKKEIGLGEDRHVGPIAQDWNEQFPSTHGMPNNMLDVADMLGVMFSCIKNIDERLRKIGV